MDTLISARRVVIGPRGQVLTDGAVLVRNGVIADTGPRREVESRAPAGVLRHDHPDGTLLPGLVDAHVHLVLDAGPDRSRRCGRRTTRRWPKASPSGRSVC
ncbi:imidazolonepropionase-like domain-containing protein [Streptomyces sp. NPDC054958]